MDNNVPFEVSNLQALADFINANKKSCRCNVQRMIEMPNNWHPNARDMSMLVYMDGDTYSKFMKLVGNHNPYDDYVGHE